MKEFVRVNASDLSGPALCWALEQIEGKLLKPSGQLQLTFCAQAVDSATAERLIDKHCVWIDAGAHVPWVASLVKDPFQRQSGDTREQAACRAIVAGKLGDIIQVPKELLP